jgi:hypothetical protein
VVRFSAYRLRLFWRRANQARSVRARPDLRVASNTAPRSISPAVICQRHRFRSAVSPPIGRRERGARV